MDVLYLAPSWLICLGVAVMMLAAMEVGYRLSRHRAGVTERAHGTFGGLTAAVLALLGLLLAFSFSLSSSRYEQRQEVLTREVSAIGTCYLRADLLDEPAAPRVKQLIRTYVQGRILAHNAGFDREKTTLATAETDRAQNAIWKIIVAEQRRDPPLPTARMMLMTDAVNEMFDARTKRNQTYRVHVSEAVVFLLMLNGVAAAFLVGCTFGMAGTRNAMAWLAFVLLTSMMVYAILDMDRPRRGIIRVGQQPMLELRDDLNGDATGSGGAGVD
ncbi:MAG: hypothetical protein WBD40_11715 [Tepidisphaeraceae bacterium]